MSIDLPPPWSLPRRGSAPVRETPGDAALAADPLDWRYKGLLVPPGTRPQDLANHRLSVVAGDLPTPVVTLSRAALIRNIELMAEFCADRSCWLAPHVKTTMSPQLWRMQLDAGAWALTVATFSQARALRAFGVQRILLANQLVDRVALEWVAGELAADPSFEFYCLADSLEGVRLMESALSSLPESARPIQVLVEVGYPGGRTGSRHADEAVEIARHVAASPSLCLRGVEGFEGYIGQDGEHGTLAAVDAFLDTIREVATAIAMAGLVEGVLLVSAGGSAYFDRVMERLGGPTVGGQPSQAVLRSGCYVSHDSDFYRRLSPFDGRSPGGGGQRLTPAIDLWATVLSRPEPGLAIANFGKRDVGHDAGPPLPHSVVREGRLSAVAAEIQITLLHDQHAHVQLPGDYPLAVGDMIVCGVSHPCTTFDKWRVIPMIDDEHVVVDAVHTFF